MSLVGAGKISRAQWYDIFEDVRKSAAQGEKLFWSFAYLLEDTTGDSA